MADLKAECWKGWKPAHRQVPDGRCCCNCVSHKGLHSHPWVDKKPMSHKIGWVCVTDGLSPRIATISNRHGLCELHEYRSKWAKDNARKRSSSQTIQLSR
jgi:hypothetical protein